MNLATKEHFTALITPYASSPDSITVLWKEIETDYRAKNRHYHNLKHLNAMFHELDHFTGEIEDKEILSFSIWYHDIIYNASKNNNEELSAKKARNVLSSLGLEASRIELCHRQILATKSHQLIDQNSPDLTLLLDFDLEVLGRKWEEYLIYSQQIRKEYSIYPWPMYQQGRKKALKSFLERDIIYHSTLYQNRLESRARENIQKEIEML